MVSAFGSGPGGSLTFSVGQQTPPANDDFANPSIIPGIPFTTTEDTSAATAAPDDPSCSGNANSVWFAYTPTQSQRIEVNTSGSSYFTSESVYTGTRGSLTQVACDAFLERVRFNVVAGQTYYIMIASAFFEGGGNLNLTVSQAPPPFSINLMVNPVELVVPSTGVVTVRGTVSCNQPTYGFVEGTIQEKVGGKYSISGFFSASISCDGSNTPISWSTTLTNSNNTGPFRPGPVIGSAMAFVLNPDTEFFMNLPPAQIVRLAGTHG
jgi:hypothetical protein